MRKRSNRKLKKPFGGYYVCFANREETLIDVFGKGKLTPPQMTKKIWNWIKKHPNVHGHQK